MRSFERQEGESSKAYRAFTTFRDLGPDRSLAKAAQLVYGSTSNVRQLSRWSARFSWRDRVQAYDDWRQMIVQHAIEEKARAHAEEVAAREQKLKEDILEIRELAARKVRTMLSWPLVEEVVKRDLDGREVEVHYMPTRWSLATVPGLVAIVRGREGDVPAAEDLPELDLSELTEDEIQTMLDLSQKVRIRGSGEGT